MSKVTIGNFSKNIIATQSNLSNQEVLDLVLKEFPNAKTSLSCIAWYKSDMKKNGHKVQQSQVERTSEIVQQEIEELTLKLELLQEELQLLQEEQVEKDEAMLQHLLKKLNKEIVA